MASEVAAVGSLLTRRAAALEELDRAIVAVGAAAVAAHLAAANLEAAHAGLARSVEQDAAAKERYTVALDRYRRIVLSEGGGS